MQDYKEYHNIMNVHYVITMPEKEMEKAEKQGFHEFFKLSTKINTGNMVCFDFDGKIKKYNSAEEIIEDFYPKRLAYYQKRKVWSSQCEESSNICSRTDRTSWQTSYRTSSTSSITRRVSSR